MAFPDINKTLALMGRKATEKVTGITGTVTGVTFDLFGCVTGLLTPPAVDNKAQPIGMYDINRLTVSDEVVMDPPERDADYINHALSLLGLRGKDKVSGVSGVVTSIVFDLYGRVELILSKKSTEHPDEKSAFVDLAAFEADGSEPVMTPPGFSTVEPEAYDHGPANKPMRSEVAEFDR